MNLKLPVRWMMTIIVALPVGTAAAQQPPIADKPRQEAQVATKQALATPAVSKEQPVATAAKSELEAAAPGNSKPAAPLIQTRQGTIGSAFRVDLPPTLLRPNHNLNPHLF